MTTDASTWELTSGDDTFHPRTDDPWWTETVWFAWMVPERSLVGYLYPVFRPNLGVQAGGILVFDDTAELPWELPVFEYDWHRQIPPGLDLRDAQLDNGMSIKCLETGRLYELGHRSRDLELSLRAEAVAQPLITTSTPPFNHGHIDQLCHVTGTMVLHGEEIGVDCLAMRDRSWGPREDGRQPTVGYSYGAQDADNAFLAVAVWQPADDEYVVTTGFLIRDGVWAELVSGRRDVDRDSEGRPRTVSIAAEDTEGRTIQARGTTTARQVFNAYPSMFCWNSLVRWDDGGWGEDQDVWHPRRWRRYLGSLRQARRG